MVSLSYRQSVYPGVLLPISNMCSSSSISEKYLRTVPLGSHQALGWNSSTSCPDSYFHPNRQIVSPGPGHSAPMMQQLLWHPLILTAFSEIRCDPRVGAATLHHNQQSRFAASCSRNSTHTESNYTTPWDIILLQILRITSRNPSLSCIWEAGARRLCSKKTSVLNIVHTGQKLFITTL